MCFVFGGIVLGHLSGCMSIGYAWGRADAREAQEAALQRALAKCAITPTLRGCPQS